MPTARELGVTERRNQVWRLRIMGNTLKQIAEETGHAMATIREDLKAEYQRLNDITREMAAGDREIELQRMDMITLTCTTILADPGASRVEVIAATDRLLKVVERRAKFLGLDAADKHEVSVLDGPTPEAAARLVREAFGGAAAKEPA